MFTQVKRVRFKGKLTDPRCIFEKKKQMGGTKNVFLGKSAPLQSMRNPIRQGNPSLALFCISPKVHFQNLVKWNLSDMELNRVVEKILHQLKD